MLKIIWRTPAIILLAAASAGAQTAAETQKILERLDRLESENQRLSEEITALRSELSAARAKADPPATVPQPAPTASQTARGEVPETGALEPSVNERLDVHQTRIAELDQKKVESSQKMPVQLTGMLLFNAFQNGHYSGTTLPDPVVASSTAVQRLSGATFRQTVLGLRFFGPDLPGGGKVSGSVYMDFFAGTNQPNNNLFRFRLATVDLAWKNTTVTVGQDKPIIAPRDPTSLAQVGVSPLTGAGNLWQWMPQARIEQRFTLSENSEIRAQAGVYESNENANTVPAEYSTTLGVWRPAYEERILYTYSHGNRRFEIAPGFHVSSSRVAGLSVPSRAVSLDGLVRPWSRVEFTGAWFYGKNLAGLGTLRQGFTILPSDGVIPVHSDGGWGQMTIKASPRWSFNLFGGVENDRASDLIGNGISRNFLYGGNAMWKLAPNVMASLELTQVRTTYLISGTRLNNHYDLALGYFF